MNRLLRAGMLGAAFVLLCAAAPADSRFADVGAYKVYVRDKSLGVENFSFEAHGDSILVFSHINELLPRPNQVDTLEKHVAMAFNAMDFDLRGYESVELINRDRAARKLVMGDTAFSSYRETRMGGVDNRLVRPPGRIFPIEPQVFVQFDVICRNLFGSSVDERPITVLLLGIRDTVIAAKARQLGTETITWGGRPVRAQKMSISDDLSEFLAWVSPTGKMLRLTRPAAELRVERQPPPVKRASPRPRPRR